MKTPTVLGISNISYGLPSRSLLNRTYLAMAFVMDLDIAILNPLGKDIIETLYPLKYYPVKTVIVRSISNSTNVSHSDFLHFFVR